MCFDNRRSSVAIVALSLTRVVTDQQRTCQFQRVFRRCCVGPYLTRIFLIELQSCGQLIDNIVLLYFAVYFALYIRLKNVDVWREYCVKCRASRLRLRLYRIDLYFMRILFIEYESCEWHLARSIRSFEWLCFVLFTRPKYIMCHTI